jgi:hypothetical protein
MLKNADETAINWHCMDTETQDSGNDGKALANSTFHGEIIQRFRGRRPSLRSLTGTCRESASLYVAWKRGYISRADYLVGVRGLSVHKDVLVALEQERMREYADSMQQQLEQLQQRPALTPYASYGVVEQPEAQP